MRSAKNNFEAATLLAAVAFGFALAGCTHTATTVVPVPKITPAPAAGAKPVVPEAKPLPAAIQPAPDGLGHTSTMTPTVVDGETQVIEVMYYTRNPDGSRVGIPGPNDDLVEIVRHQNGKLWPGQKVSFDITSGSRGVSLVKDTPPYVHHLDVITDDQGVARVYLQPFPK